jgi:peroxiredoxin/mono/diheme cytochrome c family protein
MGRTGSAICWGLLLIGLIVLGPGWQPYAAHAGDVTRIGRAIESFALPDIHNRPRSIQEFADRPVLVVVFLGTECPLVKLYGPRLAELSAEFSPRGVQFMGINANLQDTMTEMAAFGREAGFDFPLLKDVGNLVADQFQATRTPEVFVLDAERKVRYHGRIDDQYGTGSSSGYARNEIGRRDLAMALEELLANQMVSVPETHVAGCLIGRVARVAPHGEVTYSRQIARILQSRCVECHRPGQVGPFALTSYDEVVGWADMIREVVREERMPPWFANPEHGKFSNDCRLTTQQKQQIESWVECGCPEGDRNELPPPREFVEGWKIGEPDAIVYMDERPFTVAAEGVIDYQYYLVDPHFTEDKWVQGIECRPGNRSVVHHVGVTLHTASGAPRGKGVLIGYAPGMSPTQYPEGIAMRIPAGTFLKFQMHYTPNGYEQTDRSAVGFKFVDPATVRKEARGGLCGTFALKIPAGDPNHKVTSTLKFGRDSLLVNLLPHMHLRGKSFRYEVAYPDGTSEILLDVPHYDFNWQWWYELSEPKLLPKGTKMTCTAYFDNSADNPHNPDPTATVEFGEQSWQEMMYGFMTTLDAKQDLVAERAAKVSQAAQEVSTEQAVQ